MGGMAAKTTLNAKNLETLGAPRLAELLIELSTGNAAAKRKLRLELAGEASPQQLAQEVRKRLVSIGKAKSFIDWQKRKAFVVDLETQRQAIGKIAKVDPREALELAWRFLDLASSVYERSDDGSGATPAVFAAMLDDLGPIAEAARPELEALAETVSRVVQGNDYGQFDRVIETLAPVLGEQGLARLEALLESALQAASVEEQPRATGRVAGLRDREDFERSYRERRLRRALQAIADARGDVDGFIARYDAETRRVPGIAADIASRLLAAGRIEEAWTAIEAGTPKPRRGDRADRFALIESIGGEWVGSGERSWEETRLAVMEAKGMRDEAQAFRWACFAAKLDAGHLRAYLKRLPDFDDLEAEAKALAHVVQQADVHRALHFLIEWPALDKAAAMLCHRYEELDGDVYPLLTPAADKLAGKQPLAATLCLRAMIAFTLDKAKSSRYGHAARHLATCTSLAPAITSYDGIEPHEAFVTRLRATHGRKYGFWTAVG